MYIANVAIILGLGFVFQSWRLFVWAAVLFIVFHLFVIAYEEPTLHRLFGHDYETYRRAVGRWIPRWSRRQVGRP
jgi:protein-S-isoprenylcysteine O-methyltransferase Ste14